MTRTLLLLTLAVMALSATGYTQDLTTWSNGFLGNLDYHITTRQSANDSFSIGFIGRDFVVGTTYTTREPSFSIYPDASYWKALSASTAEIIDRGLAAGCCLGISSNSITTPMTYPTPRTFERPDGSLYRMICDVGGFCHLVP